MGKNKECNEKKKILKHPSIFKINKITMKWAKIKNATRRNKLLKNEKN